MRSHGLIDCTFNNIWTTVFHKRRRTHFGTRIEICAAHWCRWRSELASSIPVGPTQNCTWRWTSTICIINYNWKREIQICSESGNSANINTTQELRDTDEIKYGNNHSSRKNNYKDNSELNETYSFLKNQQCDEELQDSVLVDDTPH